MKLLKVGIFVDQLTLGGVQISAIEYTKELNKLGINTELLILMRKGGEELFNYLIKDIPHRFLSDSYPLIFRKGVKFPIFKFFSTLHLLSPLLAPNIVPKNNFDLLISMGTSTCTTVASISKKLKVPYFAIIHDPISYILKKIYSQTILKLFFPLLIPFAKYIDGVIVRSANKTIIISSVHRKYFQENFKINPLILGLAVNSPKTLLKIIERSK